MALTMPNALQSVAMAMIGLLAFAIGQTVEKREFVGSNRLVLFIRGVWNEFFDLLQQVPHIVAILATNVFFLKSYGSSVLPESLALMLGIGVEWACLRGVVTPHDSRWSLYLTGTAFVTSLMWGILYVQDASAAAAALAAGVEYQAHQAWWKDALHVVPVSLMSLFSLLLHRDIVLAEQAKKAAEEAKAEAKRLAEEAEAKRLAEEERQRAIAAQEEDRKRQRDREDKEHELKLWRESQAFKAEQETIKAASRAAQRAQMRLVERPSAPTTPAADNGMSHDQRVEFVRQALLSDPKYNRTKLHKELGVSRTALYEILIPAAFPDGLPTKE